MYIHKNLKMLKGDASSRKFFRNKGKDFSTILVQSKNDKKINLLIYDSINKILIKNDILAPKLIKENYSKNFIEIEDFGDQTIFNLFKNKNVVKLKILKKTIDLLIKIQNIRQRKIMNFKKKIYKVPLYNKEILFKEAKLFSDWYIDQKLIKSKKSEFKKKFLNILKDLIKKLKLNNDTFVHRDFHISNLMIVKDSIGVIDSQDALIGNKAYDVASLIDDVRFVTTNKTKKKLLDYYLKLQKKTNIQNFKNDFEIISVLRNLKILGIFTRLAKRDNKKKYLKLIPYTWYLIKLRSKNNEKFKMLNDLLNNFTKLK